MKKSITRNISFALLGYTLFIVLLLWLFQISFLNSYYQIMQKGSIGRASNKLIQQMIATDPDEPFDAVLERISFSHRMCSLLLDGDGNEITSIDMLGRGCMIHSPARFSLAQLLTPLLDGEQNNMVVIVNDRHFKGDQLVSATAVTLPDGARRILVLNAWLQPVGSTQEILKSQLFIITCVLALLALGISWSVARRIARPVDNLTKKARRLADGDYTADFDGGGISELDRLAETLNFAAEGLSRVEELRRELVANVSHDLKTPLTMIKAYAEMIRDLTGGEKSKRDQQLEVIISESDRLSELVSDLIRVSRDEDAQQRLSPAAFDFSELLRDTVERFRQICPDYSLSLDCPEASPVFADQNAVSQAVYNLISNAVNYTGADRAVRLSVRPIGDRLRFEVRDSGQGIPADELPLIWERYYRSRNTHQRPVTGTGLGLSIVRSALARQNLPFGVDSVVGEGSCFWFELPRASAPGAPPQVRL